MNIAGVLCVGIVLAPWLFMGARLLNMARTGNRDFYILAGVLTLKPLLTIPIANAYIGPSRQPSLTMIFLAMLPDVLITTLVVLNCRPVFSGPLASKAWLLLGLDAVRMVNMLLYMLLFPAHQDVFSFTLIGLPIVYALVASRLASQVGELA
jgi:hypothetical protein